MSLPAPQLDNRTFQDLVSEARRRIARTCPEWTDHNVSDPGITLIELFAWMTEMLTYRINKLPRKIHIALLELVGIRLDPPSAATTDVRFRLASPATRPVTITGRRPDPAARHAEDEAGAPTTPTEVATRRTPSEEAVVFEVDETFVIRPVRLATYAIHKNGSDHLVGVSADGQALPAGADQLIFSAEPTDGDGIFLGFESPLDRLVLQLDISDQRALGVGIRPAHPPRVWEVSVAGDREWEEAHVLADGTGGFNYGSGIVELQLPLRSERRTEAGHEQSLHWLRCRIEGAGYSASPRITRIATAVVGALVTVRHATTIREEIVGQSDGTPDQTFRVRNVPALPLEVRAPTPGQQLRPRDAGTDPHDAEQPTLEVRPAPDGEWQRWELRESFADSEDGDRHFSFDATSGEVQLGPAIRNDDGTWSQHGAIPRKGATLRLSYRHGGGQQGNVDANKIAVLRTAITGVASVTNPRPATGGVDAETIDRAHDRAKLELRSGYRAVTAEDFTFLAEESRRVARAVCLEVNDGVAVHILPVASRAAAAAPTRADVSPPSDLLEEVKAKLDERRLLGTSVVVKPIHAVWISVDVELRVTTGSGAEAVQRKIDRVLRAYLNPWTGGAPQQALGIAAGDNGALPAGGGWPFGRDPTEGELYGLVHAIDEVEAVTRLTMYRFDPGTGQIRDDAPLGPRHPLPPSGTVVSGEHRVNVLGSV